MNRRAFLGSIVAVAAAFVGVAPKVPRRKPLFIPYDSQIRFMEYDSDRILLYGGARGGYGVRVYWTPIKK